MRHASDGQIGKLMETLQTIGRTVLAVLLCAAVLVWSVMPSTSHAPAILDVLQDHAEMIWCDDQQYAGGWSFRSAANVGVCGLPAIDDHSLTDLQS